MPQGTAVTPEQFSNFGELLKFLRHRAGMNQRDLSIAVNYSEAQISRLEHDRRAPDAAILRSRFVPALGLEREPHWAARLLELGARTRDEQGAPEKKVPAARHNLPTQLTSFVGREESLKEIAALLGNPNCRLLTLVGAGGIGKTRLALKAAAQQLDAFRDGVFFVSLVGIQAGQIDSIAPAIAEAIGYEFVGANEPRVQLGNHLRALEMLMVLDSFEHLLEGREIVNELLKTAPAIKFMVTTRQSLNLQAEWVMRVDGLSYPPSETGQDLIRYSAVQLFLERAGRADGHFKLDRETAGTVVRICQRVEGMPLALELAAARLRTQPVSEIAAQLEQSFVGLETTMLDIETRHSSLRAVLDWSYGLLEPAEQILFRRLAVFQGGWAPEAAETVCSDGLVTRGSVFHLLGKFVDKSLVLVEQQNGATRYRMLETIRQYALEKLMASGETESVRRLHVEYYLLWAQTGMPGPEGHPKFEWLARMRVEYDNLRAALTWSQSARGGAELGLKLVTTMNTFWEIHALWSEGRAWLEGALALADTEGTAQTEVRAAACYRLGMLMNYQGDFAAAQARLTESLLLFQQVGNLKMRAELLGRMGLLAREQGDAKTASTYWEEVLALKREWGDKTGLAWSLVSYGAVAVMVEDTAWATSLIQESLTLFRELGDFDHVIGQAWAYNHLGHVAQLRGEYEQATRLHEDSLSLFQRYDGQYLGNAWAYQSLGETALGQANAELARKHLIEALALFRKLGDRKGMAWCLGGLAGVAFLNEEPEHAAFLWGAAEAVRHSLGTRPAPASRVTRERLMAKGRAQLGDEVFNEAWDLGRRAPIEVVIADVLNESMS